MSEHLIPLDRFSEGTLIWVASIGKQYDYSPYHWVDFFIPKPFIVSKLEIKKTNFDSQRNIQDSHTIKLIATLDEYTHVFNLDIIIKEGIEYVKADFRQYIDFDYDIVYNKLLKDSISTLKEKWAGMNNIKAHQAFKDMIYYEELDNMFKDYPELLI